MERRRGWRRESRTIDAIARRIDTSLSIEQDDNMNRNIVAQAAPPAALAPAAGALAAAVLPQALAAPGAVPSADDYVAKLVKLIPSDVVAVYLVLDGIVRSIPNASSKLYVGIGIPLFLLVATPFWLNRVAKITDPKHIAISTLSFAVWAVASGGSLQSAIPWYSPYMGTILMVLFTFAVPILVGKPDP